MNPPALKRFFLILTLLAPLLLSACGLNGVLGPTPTPTIPPTPTATPVPLALSVNGEGITVPEFDAELARYQQAQAALGNTVTQEVATQAVLDNFIDTLLLSQGAAASGYQVTDAVLQARIDALVSQIGSAQALSDWQKAHGYTDADFRSDLRRQLAAAQMRDQIVATVPLNAEQVHVKQILL
jgi:hypothetical protein